MALHKKGKRPPNPDPENCVWIITKEGGYRRRKRGTVNKVKLNMPYPHPLKGGKKTFLPVIRENGDLMMKYFKVVDSGIQQLLLGRVQGSGTPATLSDFS